MLQLFYESLTDFFIGISISKAWRKVKEKIVTRYDIGLDTGSESATKKYTRGLLLKFCKFHTVIAHGEYHKHWTIFSKFFRDAHEGFFAYDIFCVRSVATKTYRKVTHCIFDLDGTILDSEAMYHKILRQLCKKYGKTYTEELQSQIYGATDYDICVLVVKKLDMPISAKELNHQLLELSHKYLPSATLRNGIERLLKHLHSSNIPLAIATNSTIETVRLHRNARPGLFSYFNHYVCATDPEVNKGKPHPDIYRVAASRFPGKPKPKDCLVFEDSPIGVQAAISAGMQVVMIPETNIDRKQTWQATLVLRSLLCFEPEEFGLPPFKSSA